MHLLLPFDKNNEAKLQCVLFSFLNLYKERNSTGKIIIDKIMLSYVMMFGCDVLHQVLKDTAYRKIKTRISHSIFKKMKKWSLKDIFKIGEIFYLEHLSCLKSRRFVLSSEGCHIRAQYEHEIIKDYDKAKMYYILSIVDNSKSHSLVHRVVGLYRLSNNCLMNKEYLIGIKILRSADKLCGDYFMKLMRKEYANKYDILCDHILKLVCAFCEKRNGNDGTKLKCCKSCMNTFYCNKKCQKLHWKIHKHKCNKTWINLYPSLKICIFDPLNRKISFRL